MNRNQSRHFSLRRTTRNRDSGGRGGHAATLLNGAVRRGLAPIAVGCLPVLVLLAAGCQPPAALPENHPAVGSTMGQVQLTPLLDTQEALDRDQLDDQVTLLHFWGTWCGPCRVEYPELVETFADLQPVEDFRFVTVSCPGSPTTSLEELRSETAAYYESLGASVPTHADPQGVTQSSVVDVLGRTGMVYPTTILLDRQGIVRGVWEGYHPDGVAQMYRAAADLLQSQPAA